MVLAHFWVLVTWLECVYAIVTIARFCGVWGTICGRNNFSTANPYGRRGEAIGNYCNLGLAIVRSARVFFCGVFSGYRGVRGFSPGTLGGHHGALWVWCCLELWGSVGWGLIVLWGVYCGYCAGFREGFGVTNFEEDLFNFGASSILRCVRGARVSFSGGASTLGRGTSGLTDRLRLSGRRCSGLVTRGTIISRGLGTFIRGCRRVRGLSRGVNGLCLITRTGTRMVVAGDRRGLAVSGDRMKGGVSTVGRTRRSLNRVHRDVVGASSSFMDRLGRLVGSLSTAGRGVMSGDGTTRGTGRGFSGICRDVMRWGSGAQRRIKYFCVHVVDFWG